MMEAQDTSIDWESEMSSVSDRWGTPTVWTCHNSSGSSNSTGLHLEIERPT